MKQTIPYCTVIAYGETNDEQVTVFNGALPLVYASDLSMRLLSLENVKSVSVIKNDPVTLSSAQG